MFFTVTTLFPTACIVFLAGTHPSGGQGKDSINDCMGFLYMVKCGVYHASSTRSTLKCGQLLKFYLYICKSKLGINTLYYILGILGFVMQLSYHVLCSLCIYCVYVHLLCLALSVVQQSRWHNGKLICY